jgi:hypothetical protein
MNPVSMMAMCRKRKICDGWTVGRSATKWLASARLYRLAWAATGTTTAKGRELWERAVSSSGWVVDKRQRGTKRVRLLRGEGKGELVKEGKEERAAGRQQTSFRARTKKNRCGPRAKGAQEERRRYQMLLLCSHRSTTQSSLSHIETLVELR